MRKINLKASLVGIRERIKKINRREKVIAVLIFCILLGVAFYFSIIKDLPTPSKLRSSVALSTHIYDRNGKLLYEIYRTQNRTPVRLKDLPPYVYQATIAIEDKNFYHHHGISVVGGIIRALKDTVEKGYLQGGSTITQQLVKTALLTPERTIRRKIKEIILALWTERIYSKNQILEMYLNQVPYGGASYGIEEAARTYFRKDAKDLSLIEAATLAGLPRAPSLYSPYLNPDLCKKRRDQVLHAMYEQGYITNSVYQNSIKLPLKVYPPRVSIRAPHFVFYVKKQLEDKFGIQKVEEGGLSVKTTLDLNIQNYAQKVVHDTILKLHNYHVTNGALLVTRPSTGEILSMVGSYDFFATPSGSFNVTTALRQPGSSIKPINYAVAIERHLITPATMLLDIPTCFSAPGQSRLYCPVNYDGKFHGPVQVRFALGNSLNIPAVKVLALNGVSNLVASSSAFGITTWKDPSHYGLSLTLGGGEVKMTEMAEAYGVFANEGISKKLETILEIKDKHKNVLFQYKDPNLVYDIHKPLKYPKFLLIKGKRVLSSATTFLISHILLDNNARSMEFGSNSALVIKGKAVSVKTGTTNNKRDNWTIGYTPNFLVAVWVGNNDNSPMRRVASGLTGASPIWNKVMSYMLKNQPDLWPIKPQDVVGRQVCTVSGLLPNDDNPCQTRFEYFIKGTEPQEKENLKQMVLINQDTGCLAHDGDANVVSEEKMIVQDAFSKYCLDCECQNQKPEIVKVGD